MLIGPSIPALRDRPAAQFDTRKAVRPGMALGCRCQRPRRFGGLGEDPPTDAEPARDQRLAEQRRAHFGERQPPGDHAHPFAHQPGGALARPGFDCLQPCRAMEQAGPCFGDKFLDPADVGGIAETGGPHACAGFHRRVHSAASASGTGNSPARAASRWAIISIRPQRNSWTRSRSLPAILARPV